jgi:Protein of unknown function (DUF2510)
MSEARRARKAERVYESALAKWQTEHDGYAAMLETARTYEGEASSELLLKPGEHVYFTWTGASLIEDRAGPGHWAGHSQGVSIPIGSIGGRSVRYRVGASKGHYVQGTPSPTAIDTGTIHVTDQRVVFQGGKQTRECVFAKLIAVQHSADGSTTFSVSNRQKATVLHYGPTVAPAFEFRLDLALAHYRGTVDGLVHELESELQAVDARKPVEPEPPAVAPPAAAAPPVPDAATGPQGDCDPTVAHLVEANPASSPAAPPHPAPPAGWYADPWAQSSLRWWDGATWTGYVSPATAPTAPGTSSD